MAKQQIPDREPIADLITGVISQFDNFYILSAKLLASAVEVASGDFYIRYGITYLGKPFYSVVPDLVVLDYGDMMAGEEAWQFLTKQNNLYPRADVIGYRNDGADEMLVVKQLDFAMPFDVLAYKTQSDTVPFARLSAMITSDSTIYPERLTKYLPHYKTLADWQTNRE